MALLVTISVAMPASVVSELLFFCSMSGEIGSTCGCPHASEQVVDEGPTVSPTSCCEHVGETERSQHVSRVEAPDAGLALPGVARPPPMAPPELPVRVVQRMAEPGSPRGPPAVSIPIRHCSFLI